MILHVEQVEDRGIVITPFQLGSVTLIEDPSRKRMCSRVIVGLEDLMIPLKVTKASRGGERSGAEGRESAKEKVEPAKRVSDEVCSS